MTSRIANWIAQKAESQALRTASQDMDIMQQAAQNIANQLANMRKMYDTLNTVNLVLTGENARLRTENVELKQLRLDNTRLMKECDKLRAENKNLQKWRQVKS